MSGAILAGAVFGGLRGLANMNLQDILQEEEQARRDGDLRLAQIIGQENAVFSNDLAEKSAEKQRKINLEDNETIYQRRRGESEADYQRRRQEGKDDNQALLEQATAEEKQEAEALGITVAELRKQAAKKKYGMLDKESKGKGMNDTQKQSAIADLRKDYNVEMAAWDDGSKEGGWFSKAQAATNEKPDLKTWAKDTRPEEYALIWGDDSEDEEDSKKEMTAGEVIKELLGEDGEGKHGAPGAGPAEPEPEPKDMDAARGRASTASKNYGAEKKEFKALRAIPPESRTKEERARYRVLKHRFAVKK